MVGVFQNNIFLAKASMLARISLACLACAHPPSGSVCGSAGRLMETNKHAVCCKSRPRVDPDDDHIITQIP